MSEKNNAWTKIFRVLKIDKHDFNYAPFYLYGEEIKKITSASKSTAISSKELRTLCYQTRRQDRPTVFVEKGLFVLPVSN